MNYIYLLYSEKDDRFYTGSTNDLKEDSMNTTLVMLDQLEIEDHLS